MRVREQRMGAEQHQQAADDLDRVRDEHHRALGHRVGEGADDRRQDHVEQREHRRQRRDVPRGRAAGSQQLDRGDQQCVVRQRAEELRRHDGVEAFFHSLRVGGASELTSSHVSRAAAVYSTRVFRRSARPAASRSDGWQNSPMPRPIEALVHRARPRGQPRGRAPRGAAARRVWAVVKANAYGHGIANVYAGAEGRRRLRAARPRPRPSCCASSAGAARSCCSKAASMPRDLETCSRLNLWHAVHHEAQIDWLAAHKTARPHQRLPEAQQRHEPARLRAGGAIAPRGCASTRCRRSTRSR